MSRLSERVARERSLFDRLMNMGGDSLSLDEKCRLAERIRAESPLEGLKLDRLLLGRLARLTEGLQEAQANQAELKELLDRLTTPPWLTSVFLQVIETDDGPRAMVCHGSSSRVVCLRDGVSLVELDVGDEVFLNQELSLITGKSPHGVPRFGETAQFDRYTEDGRLVLRWRDEELVLEAAAPLRDVALKRGDLIRFERATWLAYERLEQEVGQQYFIGQVPDVRSDQVGGQRVALQHLTDALTTRLLERTKASLYLPDGEWNSPLLYGPPGVGKTLLARVVCNEISRVSGKQCRFAVVKPAAWWDPFVGMTERHIRETFQAAAEAAKEFGLVVIFLDEIESVGRTRGSAVSHHSDRFLSALLAELDGFEKHEGVTAMAATNRIDLCDPAILERFDLHIPIPRPDMRGAREIFGIHMPTSVPYCPNGQAAENTRWEIVDQAVSRLYAPNAENQLCTLRFRDGRQRTVTARELISGRAIAQACRAARQNAFLRDVRGGQPGVRAEDMDKALSDTIDRLSTLLTRLNAHDYLSDLPQDHEVVAVEPIVRRGGRSDRYLNVSQ